MLWSTPLGLIGRLYGPISACRVSTLLLLTVLQPCGMAANRAAEEEEPLGEPVAAASVKCGDLAAEFLDNAQSPQVLSGVDRLFNLKDATEFDAFDPHDPSGSAGLNFEHIISGHTDPANWFAPRNGPYRLYRQIDPHAVVLIRRHDEDPWAMESRTQYTVRAPHYIDFEFTCRPHDARRFGDRRSAVLFWANYMNDVEDVALHFRGVNKPGGEEQWIAADAPPGHPDYVGGGTYRHLQSPGFAYDANHNFKLNLWSYDYPRFTQPFYYGRAAHGMVLMLMFDRAYTEEDEVRFSLFKFKVGDQVRRPAWDFQYVIHRVETGKQYGFCGRLVWKRFVSDEDCLGEYAAWAAELLKNPPSATFGSPAQNARAASAVSAADPKTAESGRGWQLPPTGVVTRQYPRLMNYFHMDLRDGRADQKEKRLAQWNLLILNHDIVEREQLSLAKMREVNPRVKILAWVPLQGPHDGLSPGVPAPGDHDWYARRSDGSMLVPHWGGHLMNVYTQDFAWPKHVLDYVHRVCLVPGAYDGLMMDCLWQHEPDQQDVNGDGMHDQRDTQAWQEGMLFLLRNLRERYPDAILTGNGGGPWSDDCPYFQYANGCMHENALGDQFGGVEWQNLWDGYRRTMTKVVGREPFHLMAVDVRADRRTRFVASWLWRLSANDRRRSRLGLGTSMLLDGGYFGFDRGDCLHGQLWWLREYDADFGLPLEAFQVDRYGAGIFSRQFTLGLVIVNPTERDVSVSVSTDMIDLTTGASGTDNCTVPARDARFFVGPRVKP
ncbi:MAG: alpha-amylase family protein [Pirellulaceae bacterium]